MSQRQEWLSVLEKKVGHLIENDSQRRWREGLLDELERLYARGLAQTVDQFIAEINRSGEMGGFDLEISMANIAVDVPDGVTTCERMEGNCKVPGDIWLDVNENRFEFQCKHSLNWTVEYFIEKAVSRIEEKTAGYQPGLCYSMEPEVAGNEKEWLAFADWMIENFSNWKMGETYTFSIGEQKLATIVLSPGRSAPGLKLQFKVSPGGLQFFDEEKLKKKLSNSFRQSYRTLSKDAAENQLNCLVVKYAAGMVDEDDLSHALYGHLEYEVSGEHMSKRLVPSGLFYGRSAEGNLKLSAWSALVWVKTESLQPFEASAIVFPNPVWLSAVNAAFANFPRTRVISTIKTY